MTHCGRLCNTSLQITSSPDNFKATHYVSNSYQNLVQWISWWSGCPHRKSVEGIGLAASPDKRHQKGFAVSLDVHIPEGLPQNCLQLPKCAHLATGQLRAWHCVVGLGAELIHLDRQQQVITMSADRLALTANYAGPFLRFQ